MSQKTSEGRRNFLKHSAVGVLGTGIMSQGHWAGAETEKKDQPLKVNHYRTLGRTGFKVSEIGGGNLVDEGLISAMFDTGINYIDTAESYGNQPAIGKGIQNHDRKKIFITSKLLMEKDISKEGIYKRTLKCLEELQTDYIDCMMMHMPEKVETLKTEGFHAAMEQLKKEGKIRFLGTCHHGSFWFKDPEETMEKVLLAAAEDGRFDVFLLAYNFLQMDMGEKVLEVCHKKNIGVAVMKSTPVAKYYAIKEFTEWMQKEGKEIHELYTQGLERFKQKADMAEGFMRKHKLENPEELKDAAIRFVLSNPLIHTVCCSMRNFGDLERFVALSGTRLSDIEKKKLVAFKEGCGELYCRHACGLCEPNCPHHVPVNTIMRYNHYFVAQSREKYAMTKYAAIPGVKADVCKNCSGYCERSCPYGVPIQGMLILAHEQLTLA